MKEHDLIRKYLHGELSLKEEQIFNELLSSNPQFADEVELQSVYYADRSSNLKTELQALKPKVAETRSTSFNKIAVIAVLLCLLLVLGYLFQNQRSENNLNYANIYLEETHPAPSVLMSGKDGDVLWMECIQLYNDKNYNQAIEFFDKAIDRGLHKQQSKLYIGLSFLYQTPPKLKKAISIFLELITSKSLYSEEANWYLALAKLEQSKKDECLKLLDEIIIKKSWNHQKAKTLKESLLQ